MSYTDEDARTVDDAFQESSPCGHEENVYTCFPCLAAVAVDALRAAGRLLPLEAETRTEWAWDCSEVEPRHVHIGAATHLHRGEEDWARNTAPKYWPGGRLMSQVVCTWPDGSTWVGPWREVSDAD